MGMRRRVNKGQSARKFKGQIKHTKAVNVAPPPMRGGYRF